MLKPSDRLRALPLESVLESLGCTPDPKDPRRNWRTPVGRLTVTGERFYCHDRGQGGGGAIDLYLFITGCTAKEAIERLKHLPPPRPRSLSLDKAPSKPFQAADYDNGDPATQQAVLTYLSKQRRLPSGLIQRLMEQGQIGAHSLTATTGKKISNCAFFLRRGGHVVGVELRGIAGLFHGMRGKRGTFLVTDGKVGTGPLALVESAIDALSLHTLQGIAVASIGGDSPMLAVAAAQYWLVCGGGPIYAAQDTDSAGERQAQALTAVLPQVQRLRPPSGKDWNEHL